MFRVYRILGFLLGLSGVLVGSFCSQGLRRLSGLGFRIWG